MAVMFLDIAYDGMVRFYSGSGVNAFQRIGHQLAVRRRYSPTSYSVGGTSPAFPCIDPQQRLRPYQPVTAEVFNAVS